MESWRVMVSRLGGDGLMDKMISKVFPNIMILWHSSVQLQAELLNGFLSASTFFETGLKKEIQKDQDANRPAISSPKRSAVTATKLHSPGIYELKNCFREDFNLSALHL